MLTAIYEVELSVVTGLLMWKREAMCEVRPVSPCRCPGSEAKLEV